MSPVADVRHAGLHQITQGRGGTYLIHDPSGKLVRACITMDDVWAWIYHKEEVDGKPLDFVMEYGGLDFSG